MVLSSVADQRDRVLAAKLSLPHMGFVLSRPRLHALLEPVRRGGIITLVAGPGCGKTMVARDKARMTQNPCWLSPQDRREPASQFE